jgi:hypothetical protein
MLIILKAQKIDEVYKRIKSKSIDECYLIDYIHPSMSLCVKTPEDNILKISFESTNFLTYIQIENDSKKVCYVADIEEARILWRYLVLEGFECI